MHDHHAYVSHCIGNDLCLVVYVDLHLGVIEHVEQCGIGNQLGIPSQCLFSSWHVSKWTCLVQNSFVIYDPLIT
jgi:hypothetical protein